MTTTNGTTAASVKSKSIIGQTIRATSPGGEKISNASQAAHQHYFVTLDCQSTSSAALAASSSPANLHSKKEKNRSNKQTVAPQHAYAMRAAQNVKSNNQVVLKTKTRSTRGNMAVACPPDQNLNSMARSRDIGYASSAASITPIQLKSATAYKASLKSRRSQERSATNRQESVSSV